MAKPTSLAAAAKAPEAPVAKPAFNMPAVFTAPVTPIQARAWAPQITFAHPKRKDEWNKINAKFGTVEEGEPYFIYKDRIVKLERFKLSWIAGTQYWAVKDQAGKMEAASFAEKPRPFVEYIEAAVLAYVEGDLFPANIRFKKAKCPCGKALSDGYVAASSPDWSEKSEAHKQTLRLEQPFLRYYGECILGDPRPSKRNGLPYRPLSATIKPTTSVEWAAIAKLQEDPELQHLMDLVAERYTQNLEDLKPLLVE